MFGIFIIAIVITVLFAISIFKKTGKSTDKNSQSISTFQQQQQQQQLSSANTQETALHPVKLSKSQSFNEPIVDGDILSIGHLKVYTNKIIGYGNSGTIVYQGELEHRDVAVKRLLKHNTTVARSEISLLIEADEHPNVVRYYASETDSQFIYLALTLCKSSLTSWVEEHIENDDVEYQNIFSSFLPLFLLSFTFKVYHLDNILMI